MNSHSKEIITFNKLFNNKVIIKKDSGICCPQCNESLTPNAIDCEDPGCLMIHPDDTFYCFHCNWEGKATDVLDIYLLKKNYVPCPCCHGQGFVSQNRKHNIRAAMKFWKDTNQDE